MEFECTCTANEKYKTTRSALWQLPLQGTRDTGMLPLLAVCTVQSPGFSPQFVVICLFHCQFGFLELMCLSWYYLRPQGRCLPLSLTFTFVLSLQSCSHP